MKLPVIRRLKDSGSAPYAAGAIRNNPSCRTLASPTVFFQSSFFLCVELLSFKSFLEVLSTKLFLKLLPSEILQSQLLQAELLQAELLQAVAFLLIVMVFFDYDGYGSLQSCHSQEEIQSYVVLILRSFNLM